jgi:hypothetical protein
MDQNSQRFALWELQQEIFSLFLKRKTFFLKKKKRTFNKEVRDFILNYSQLLDNI